MFSLVLGVLFFLVFLLFALQLMVGAYATSAVTSAAYDAARYTAQTGNPSGGVAKFRSLGLNATITIVIDGDNVIATVRADNPSLLPSSLAGGMPFGDVERTIRVRLEEFQT